MNWDRPHSIQVADTATLVSVQREHVATHPLLLSEKGDRYVLRNFLRAPSIHHEYRLSFSHAHIINIDIYGQPILFNLLNFNKNTYNPEKNLHAWSFFANAHEYPGNTVDLPGWRPFDLNQVAIDPTLIFSIVQ